MADLLKTAMDDAAAECSLAVPTVFATNTTDSYVQLKRYMRQTADELLGRIDWAALTLDATITGDGTDTYDLPSDFKRLVRRDEEHDPAVWSDDMRRAFRPVTSNGQWTVLTAMGPTPSYGYRIVGSTIQFTQVLAVGETATMAYVSNAWIESSGTPTASWTDDADYTLLPPKLIELGTTWRWRRKRGLEFSSYQGDFEIQIARLSNDDRSIRKISFGETVGKSGTSPYDGLPVPLLGPDPNV